jgi:predicted dehydrogenase
MTTKQPEQSSREAVSRRAVVAAGLAPLVLPRHVLGGRGYQAPSDTLAIAAVGVGGMGRNYLEGCKQEKIVALCDLDHNYAATAFDTYPAARRYHDYREMFDKEARNFDALIIAVPDHMHAILLMAAIEMNKHIYCAKPIAHSIGEVRKVRQALLEAKGIVTKGSIQDSRTDYSRSTTEILISGVLGPIREIHIWTFHPIYPCSLVRPTEIQTPPAGMDWDLWIGPAPYRPYHRAYHPANWRAWWDFGEGDVGDMGCHTFHTYFEELRLAAPSVVYGYCSTRYDDISKPAPTPETEGSANVVSWEYPPRGGMPPLKMFYYDGGIKPPRPAELDHSTAMPREGVLFVGDQGKLMSSYYGGNPFAPFGRPPSGGGAARGLPGGLLLPESRFKDFEQPAKTLPRCERADHYTDWTRSCKTGTPTALPIEFACRLTELALLGTLALRTGKTIEWDADAMRVTNDADANQYVAPPYRAGWQL